MALKFDPTSASGLLGTFRRLKSLPGGTKAFSKLLGTMVPYSGSISPHVVELEPGHARVQLKDRRAVRNHLKSVHAIALVNLAEISSGLALLTSIPDDGRGILVGFRIQYSKKSRGLITAEARRPVETSNERRETEVEVVLTDSSGDEVARAWANWLIGPKGKKAESKPAAEASSAE